MGGLQVFQEWAWDPGGSCRVSGWRLLGVLHPLLQPLDKGEEQTRICSQSSPWLLSLVTWTERVL